MTNSKLTDEEINELALKLFYGSTFYFQSGRRAGAKTMAELLNKAACAVTELQERRKSFRWISIDEELPEDESTVIVKNIDGVQWVADFNDDCFYPDEFPVYKMGGDEVTHWMRFPE